MSRRRETKSALRGKVAKQSTRLGSRTESAQGEGDSVDRDTFRRREKWSEEAVFEKPQRPENIGEMSRKNREKVEEREEVEGVQPPLVTAMCGGGGNDMVLMMQMWMEESKRKDETWRTEMRL